MKIGIVGQGYVGTAIKVVFESYYELETYDKFSTSKSTCNLHDLVLLSRMGTTLGAYHLRLAISNQQSAICNQQLAISN